MANQQITVTSGYISRCQPYKVKMACGHIETRMMREATAGIPWTPDATLETPRVSCAECRAKYGECYLPTVERAS